MTNLWLVRDRQWELGDLILSAETAEDAARAAMAHTKLAAVGLDDDRMEDFHNLSGDWLVHPLTPKHCIQEDYRTFVCHSGDRVLVQFIVGEPIKVKL